MLYLHQGNDLTKLADTLVQHMQQPSSDVLQAQVILVQNPGMKRWLQQHICRNTGIAANLEFPLPSRFIWDICLSTVDEAGDLQIYDQAVLRWRLMQLLSKNLSDRELKPLANYLRDDPLGVARFQLAEKLASLFDQYQVYRADMIRNWEKGHEPESSVENWQSHLWKLLRRQRQEPHRAELIHRLLQKLSAQQDITASLPQNLYVFGLSALSPQYMKVLVALSEHINVYLFYLNPCQHYWGDIRSQREKLREQDSSLSENQLLASLGQQGREFIDQIYQHDMAFEDSWHFHDVEPNNLLQRIKHDILNLNPPDQSQDYRDDQSIQIVSCYSELRELQVLHDHILSRLSQDESLQAHEIVVMCPDINTLAPYIRAVFGEQPDNRRLPFSISDHNPLSESPLVQAILEWMQLPNSRLTVNEVLAWLEIPALRRRYCLDEDELQNIRYWIKNNHIHWGLDGEFKSRFGLGDDDMHSWRFGIDRLLTAYTMHESIELFEGQVASDVILNQGDLSSLSKLQRLLDDLADWSSRLARPARLETWQQRIHELIDCFIKPDSEEEWLLNTIRDAIAEWADQVTLTRFNEEISGELITQLLQNVILQGTANHPYLTGGINFCNLIPMRCLPFREVCLVGLGDDRFPRSDISLQFDLMSLHPRHGDRSRREDDRYMFLQSLLSAKDGLYVSYVGRNKQDDSEIQPSVVITELINHVQQSTGYRLPIRQTALQVFSERSFEQGSYAKQWQLLADTPAEVAFNQNIGNSVPTVNIALDKLVEFYMNPARFFMRHRLNLTLGEFTDDIDDDEIFALDPLSRYRLNTRLLDDLFEHRSIEQIKYTRSGELPARTVGEIQFDEQRENMTRLFTHIKAHEYFTGRTAIDDTIKIHGYNLSGTIVSYSDKGLLLPNLSKPSGRHLFSVWIKHCFLAACNNSLFTELVYLDGNRLKKAGFEEMSVANAMLTLQNLLQGFELGQQSALPFYVDSAYEYEKEKARLNEAAALSRIAALWRADDNNRFFEAEDIYLQTSRKNPIRSATDLEEEFFQLSARFMLPMLEALENR